MRTQQLPTTHVSVSSSCASARAVRRRAVIHAMRGVICAAAAGCLTLAIAWAAPPPPEPDAPRPEIAPLYEEALLALDEGDGERARALLMTVLEHDPDHAGAWLDLALLLCRAGDRQSGRDILARVRSEYAPPPAIRTLIDRLADTACAPTRPWRLHTGLAFGHDDNVNLGASQSYARLITQAGVVDVLLGSSMQARADAFAEFWAEMGRPGLPARLSVVLRRHAREDEFDSYLFSLEGWRSRADAGAQTLVRAFYTHTGLGGRPFLHSLGLEFGRHGLGCSLCPSAQLRVGLQRFPDHGVYDSAVGELRLGARLEAQDRALRAWASVQGDHALGVRPGGDRIGAGLEFEGLLRPAPGLWLQVRLGLHDLQDARPYAEPLLPWRRRRQVQTHRIEVHKNLGRGLDGFVGWYRSASDGNISFLDYHSDSVRLGLNWVYE